MTIRRKTLSLWVTRCIS